MTITRTANAGVLLESDGVNILLDGVAKTLYPYEATVKEFTSLPFPKKVDIFAFTHKHDDHVDMQFLQNYISLGVGTVISPDSEEFTFKNVTVTPIPTRHIGKCDVKHTSFIIRGSKTVFFMGDASPVSLKAFGGKADVIIAPFAYANTESSLNLTKTFADKAVILHLPKKDSDIYGLWDTVTKLTAENCADFYIPLLAEQIIL